jgi:ABC-type amino acid transport system permease subunit
VAGIATVYVETLRNIPLLVQLLFWYKAVLSVLPGPKDAVSLPLGSVISNRGLSLPGPEPQPGFVLTLLALGFGIGVAFALSRWARRRQMLTGRRFPALIVGSSAVVVVTAAAFLASGAPLAFSYPDLKGFNFVGGFAIQPEFLALLLGLVLYTGTFIAEIVRAGILAVPLGQTEAAYALGLRPGLTLRRVVIRRSGFGLNDGCEGSGQFIPFANTQAERIAAGDPRLSLEERYETHGGYVSAVANAAHDLKQQRLLLQKDVQMYINAAAQSDILK